MPQLSQLFLSFSLFICQKKNVQKWKNWRYFSGEESQIETMGDYYISFLHCQRLS